jgi:hypothetical protein
MTTSRRLHLLRLLWRRVASEVRYLPVKIRSLWLSAAVKKGYYEYFDEDALRRRIRGDTLFILGSGSSLAGLSSKVLALMRINTTMSLNYSLLQSFIQTDFHVVRELLVANDVDVSIQSSDLEKFGNLLAANPCYRDAVFLVQGGYHAWAANLLLGLQCLPRGTRIFRYRNSFLPGVRSLGSSFSAITHGASTITDCVNIGYLLGFKKIVLCGVDLYDRRYFWHVAGTSFIPLSGVTNAKEGEYGATGKLTARHRTAERLITQLAAWAANLKLRGVKLSVQNPASLLSEVLPVYFHPNSCKNPNPSVVGDQFTFEQPETKSRC